MSRRKYKCIICGRMFPEGQGIVIKYGKYTLAFHKSKCAAAFLRLLLERVPPEELEGYIKRIISEAEEKIRLNQRLKAKKI